MHSEDLINRSFSQVNGKAISARRSAPAALVISCLIIMCNHLKKYSSFFFLFEVNYAGRLRMFWGCGEHVLKVYYNNFQIF